jgi:hypothetical protein
MSFLLYDHLEADGTNTIEGWTGNLQSLERGKLNQKLDILRMHGDALIPNTLSPTDEPGILKIRVHGKVQLRPLLCRGPVQPESEYTLLVGAIEKGSELKPKGVLSQAIANKQEVVQDPVNRRTLNARCKT